MQDWNELLGVVAHDLKTPISAVKGFIELMQHVGPLNERQMHFSERALAGLQLMEQLVARLLELAWIDADRPLEPHETDLADLIAMVVELMEDQAARRNVTIEVQIDPKVGTIQAEARRLEQVFLNLLSNAVKYNREGGKVWVTVVGKKKEVQVTVKDTGQGIPPEEQDSVFERFVRAQATKDNKVEGTGLGLSIVKAVVEKHGGRLWVESVVGEGTSFNFVLPRRQPKVEHTTQEATRDTVEPQENARLHAEGTDYVVPQVTGEQIDAVDDNIQEPPQANLSDDDRGAYQG
ncbi:MAG TPA: HAMP domain-containing sensor histidine kinase [Oceanobacillus sp.]|nr:HAMP domain-containing sensor histidine kinase [Oceanobacillus sp.]